jgi:hypothetical protein
MSRIPDYLQADQWLRYLWAHDKIDDATYWDLRKLVFAAANSNAEKQGLYKAEELIFKHPDLFNTYKNHQPQHYPLLDIDFSIDL